MPLKQFSFGALETFDGGRVKVAVEQELARMQTDCEDRPHVKAARSVTLKITLNPVTDDDEGEGDLHSIDVGFQITSKTPKRDSKTYSMQPQKNGPLFYNEMSTENVNQQTLPGFKDLDDAHPADDKSSNAGPRLSRAK